MESQPGSPEPTPLYPPPTHGFDLPTATLGRNASSQSLRTASWSLLLGLAAALLWAGAIVATQRYWPVLAFGAAYLIGRSQAKLAKDYSKQAGVIAAMSTLLASVLSILLASTYLIWDMGVPFTSAVTMVFSNQGTLDLVRGVTKPLSLILIAFAASQAYRAATTR